MEVYNDLMYLPRGPFKNSCSVVLYNFVVSTTNSVINPTTMLSSQKSTAHVSLLSTHCSCTISSGFHSSCLIQFIGWLSFNLLIHSCNMCGNSQKNTSCKSVNTYLSRYLRGVSFGFLLSFCTNSSSFVFNQLFISAFVGFHGLSIPF
jgi:succinate-acetate transporter protein